jgi:hypothetical protein
MTPTFYNTQARIDALVAEANSWIGTPFMENSAAKGLGVACHFLSAAIYKATGPLPADFVTPRGSIRRLRTSPALAMVEFIDEFLKDYFEAVEPTDPKLPGDLLVGAEKGDNRARHVGTVLPGRRFVHVLRFSGVMISPLDDATFSEVLAIRRPKP